MRMKGKTFFFFSRQLQYIYAVFVFICVFVQGGALGRYVQRKLSVLNIFQEPFVSVKENLRTGAAICEQWVAACEHLTGQVLLIWKRAEKNLSGGFKTSTVSVATPHFTFAGKNAWNSFSE